MPKWFLVRLGYGWNLPSVHQVPRQNVQRDKMSGDKTSGNITAVDIISVGQNVRRD
jgi:hypothetical protein